MSDPDNTAFHSKALSVSNDEVLSASLLKEETGSLPEDILISVDTLASRQVNKGKDQYNPSKGLERGEYDFRATVMDETYQLKYIQKERLENIDTIHKMAQFLNDSVPGISAAVEKGEKPDYSRLIITSDRTGKSGPRSFSFDDDEIFKEGVVDFFGLNRMEQAPSNAEFELNGIKKQTSTNTFSIENTIQVTLRGTSEDSVRLNIVPDKNPILSSVDSFLNTFNGLIGLAKSRTEETPEHFGPTKLINEIKRLEENYKDELEANGFTFSESGILSLDDALAVQSSEDGGMEDLFTRENGFIAKVLDKTESITINPLEYLDKKVLTYPDNKKAAFASPYVSSMYSGLLFNYYC
jgi:flagellar hook-associated protein 2